MSNFRKMVENTLNLGELTESKFEEDLLDGVRSNNPSLASMCASNHAASENVLLAALDHPHEGVGVAAASNPNASEKVLLKAASSPHYMVSRAAHDNKNATDKVKKTSKDIHGEQITFSLKKLLSKK